MSEDNRDINWVKIFSTAELYKAEIAKTILMEAGIKAVILNKQDSAYVSIGYIELHVAKEQALRASNIIKEIKYE